MSDGLHDYPNYEFCQEKRTGNQKGKTKSKKEVSNVQGSYYGPLSGY